MNKENIKSLQRQISHLGFESLGETLVKKICFKPDNFYSFYETSKGNDKLNFSLYIEKNKEQNTYVLKYYDASILKEILFQHTIINGVDTSALENKMILIDWRNMHDLNVLEYKEVEDEEKWKNEILIESIVEDLQKLEEDEAGKRMALNLKIKFWVGITFLEEIGNIKPLKNNQEVSQRFYFHREQLGITIDEAYRFLQNMMVEKQILNSKILINSERDDKVKSKSKKKIVIKKHKSKLIISKDINA